MSYDFTDLDWRQFELLCGALLAAEGFFNLRQFAKPGEPDRGVDWMFDSPNGERWIAQVKAVRRPMTSAVLLRRAVVDLVNGLSLLDAQYALLIVSVPLPRRMKEELSIGNSVVIWDAELLASLLVKHPVVEHAYSAIASSQNTLEALLEGKTKPSKAGSQLIADLHAVRPGREEYRRFEDVCVAILNYAFVPPLRVPRIQTVTEDGLDRRDAIYPIGFGGPFWESIKYEFSSRMIVAEFKNYTEPIGQVGVESLQQYLLPKVKRSFGLLCSRHQPSESALKARRRAWMIADNMILFLSDGDLEEIVRLKDEEKDPSTVLDAQIDEFFITLSP
ncbi:MAG: restriction endonuclease [Anaerolineae bacterium]|nr:restriction endonuclease [Anaerolineae bacterium]